MGVQDVRPPFGVGALRERHRYPAQQREAAVIVGPVMAIGVGIGAARPVVERRMIDEVGGNPAPRQRRQDYPHPFGGKGGPKTRDLAQLERV